LTIGSRRIKELARKKARIAKVGLLAEDAEQSKPSGNGYVGDIQPDQGAITATAAKARTSLPGLAGYRGVVNQSLKSVAREIGLLRSVGAGRG
jgi:hypothetical protein